MIKTMLFPVFVLACALCARASETDYSRAEPMVETDRDFKAADPGVKDIHLKPEDGQYYWSSPENVGGYTNVSTEVRTDGINNYLYINADERPDFGLMRTFAAQCAPTGTITNAFVTVSGSSPYSGFYCRVKTKLPLFDEGEAPVVDAGDRLVVWARGAVGSSSGKLFVTAGSYTGSVRQVSRHDYQIGSMSVNPNDWHELTFRMIPDVTLGGKAPAFAVWLDGVRLTATAGDYPVFNQVTDADTLTPEAQALISSRSLFPSLIAAGGNASMVVGGASFTGVGSVERIAVSTNAPGSWANPPRAFTLNWDNGVKAIRYTIGTGSEVTVTDVASRKAVFEVPTSETKITVRADYDTAGKYSQGIWTSSGACSVVTNIVGSATNYWFVCDASDGYGEGFVRSFRTEIGLGGGGIGSYATFTDAKEQAIAQGNRVVVLKSDFSAAIDTRDEGRLLIGKDEVLTIDLNGHLLGNSVGLYPTIENRGTLTIIDSVGGGRVAPFAEYKGEKDDFKQTAVHNYASQKYQNPILTICGGTFDGAVVHDGAVTNKATLAKLEGHLSIQRRNATSNEPRFISVNSEYFEFADKVDDATLYFNYEAPYWQPLTNACIWCGKGTTDAWSDKSNWRGQKVPGVDDYVVFPCAGTNFWETDLGSGVVLKGIRFDGNVILHGTADCTGVQWASGVAGRIRGDAKLIWNGALPKDLTTLLDEAWAGTVEIANVGDTSPKYLTDLLTWGTDSSKVVFRGVRGHYHLKSNMRLPYELVLEDGDKGYAWKNDAGFNGSVIEIPVVSGSGKFVSPENQVANRQLLLFRDVSRYTGVMEVKGKRVVLGPGDAVTLEAGSITWSDGLLLPKVVAHTCSVAAFGGTMTVGGGIGDRLAYYDAERGTVGDESEVVKLDPSGALAELCVTNPVGEVRITTWSEDAAVVDGLRVVTNKLLSVNSKSLILAPSAKAAKLQFAKYYTPSVVTNDGQLAMVKLSLNQNAVPVIGGTGGESAQITFKDGLASIVVSGAIDNFWYGLEYKSELTDEWPSEPYIWTVANPLDGGKVELVAPAEGASGFYRVVVSDVEPESAGGTK